MAVITNEQRANLLNNTRFQQQCRMAIQDTASVMAANNGDATPGGMSRVDWARQRYIGYGIVQHPNSQDYSSWYAQMVGFLKDQDVWDTDENTTIDNINFEAISSQAFGLRSQNIDF